MLLSGNGEDGIKTFRGTYKGYNLNYTEENYFEELKMQYMILKNITRHLY